MNIVSLLLFESTTLTVFVSIKLVLVLLIEDNTRLAFKLDATSISS